MTKNTAPFRMTIVVTFLLFILPLIVLPFGATYFETPKIVIAEISIQVLAGVFLLRKRNIPWQPFLMYWPYVVLCMVAVIHLLFFPTESTFFGNQFRLQGVFLLWHLLFFSFLSTKIDLKVPWYFVLLCLLFLGCSLPLYGANNAARYIGTLGEPNALSAVSLFYLPWIFYMEPVRYKSFLISLGLFITIVIIGASYSESAFIALGIQFLFFMLAQKTSLNRTTILSLCFGLVVLSHLLPFFEVTRIYENRAEIWKTAWISGLESPIVGHGFGNIEHALKHTSQTLSNNVRFQYVDSSHNVFLDMWVQGGIVGLVAFGALLFRAVKTFLHHKDIFALTLFLGLITMLSFNPVSVVTLLHFWWLVGRRE